MVQLAFLGSGGGRVVVANQFRKAAGFFIQSKQHQICVDPGPGTLFNARFSGINVLNTDIIF